MTTEASKWGSGTLARLPVPPPPPLLSPAQTKVLPPDYVVAFIDLVVVIGIGGQAFVDIAKGLPPQNIICGINDAVVVEVAGNVAEKAANFTIGIRGGVNVEIRFAAVEGDAPER